MACILSKQDERVRLKKQSQFVGGANRRKLLYERILWQYIGLWVTKKQTQNKPNQSQFAK
jgi:hypothetical protein